MRTQAPEWFQKLEESGLTSASKYAVLTQVLGVRDDDALCALSDEERRDACFQTELLKSTESIVRAVLFKKPEAALNALTNLAIEAKRQVLLDLEAKPELRDKVATDVLDRALGKATQTMQIASVSVTADAKDLHAINTDLERTMKRIADIEASTNKLKVAQTLEVINGKTRLLAAHNINS